MRLIWYQLGAIYKKPETDLKSVLKEYYKYAVIWSLKSEKLVNHAVWDYKIQLELGISPKFFLIYKLIETKNQALKEFIKENLRKGYIRSL